MKLKFEKYQGCGNDFVLIDEDINPGLSDPVKKELSKRLLDRHFSIGADSLLFVKEKGTGVRFRIFEAGEELDMCGNGIRCIAAYYMQNPGVKSVKVLAPDGRARLVTAEGALYRVDMGKPQRINRYLRKARENAFIVRADELFTDMKVASELKKRGVRLDRGYFVNNGEAHLVFLVDDIEGIDLTEIGCFLAKNRRVFPESTNIDIVQLQDRGTIRVRTYERGAFQETLACGTGSLAAAYVAKIQLEPETDKIRVFNKGGEQTACFDGDMMCLIGPALKVFSGEIEIHL